MPNLKKAASESELPHLSLSISLPFPCLPSPSSSPILLSNGKPLKSSLKSPSIPSISDTLRPTHLRTRSAPATPTHKNVHFAEEKDQLESVRVFSLFAKPASLSSPREDTETETDNERDLYFSNSFPFPCIPLSSIAAIFHLDDTTSTIPSPFPSPNANILLESLLLSSAESIPVLTGFLIVRNIAYEKVVAVRFTMDNWQTTSEVLARHAPSLALTTAPPTVSRGSKDDDMWDRFAFTIRLEGYAFKLQERVMWLVARYATAGGEWWDNNEGHDYRIGFKPVHPVSVSPNTCSTFQHIFLLEHAFLARDRFSDGLNLSYTDCNHHAPRQTQPTQLRLALLAARGAYA